MLVVDDNELIATTLAMVLRLEDFDAVPAYSGHQALELLRSGSFDLLLSDVMMPQMTGIELAIEATRRQDVRCILLMAGVLAAADLLANARQLGFDFEIVPKPMTAEEMVGKIRSVLDESRGS